MMRTCSCRPRLSCSLKGSSFPHTARAWSGSARRAPPAQPPAAWLLGATVHRDCFCLFFEAMHCNFAATNKLLARPMGEAEIKTCRFFVEPLKSSQGSELTKVRSAAFKTSDQDTICCRTQRCCLLDWRLPRGERCRSPACGGAGPAMPATGSGARPGALTTVPAAALAGAFLARSRTCFWPVCASQAVASVLYTATYMHSERRLCRAHPRENVSLAQAPYVKAAGGRDAEGM